MNKQIIIERNEISHVFEMTGPSKHFKTAAKRSAREIGMGNINYEINIRSNYFASFVPFAGLGNAWGTDFGFTFGCGPYSPDEVLFGNGLFAVAEFFRNIQWVPFENAGGYEEHAEAAKEFAKTIADSVYDIGLDCGRAIFPMNWILNSTPKGDFDAGVESLTISIIPRISPSIINHDRVGGEYYLSPRQVVNALVFYAAVHGQEALKMGDQLYSLEYLMSKVDSKASEYDLASFIGSSFGEFHERWTNINAIDSETLQAFEAAPHIVEKIEELLKYRTNAAAAAWEVIMLMDSNFRVTLGCPVAEEAEVVG